MSTIQQRPSCFRQWWFVAAAVVAGVVLAMVVTSLCVALSRGAPTDQVIKVGRPGGLPEIGTEHLHGSGSMDACLTHQHPTAARC